MTIIDFGAPFRARLIRSRKTEGNTFNESREMAQKRKAARGYAADVRRRLCLVVDHGPR